MMLMGPWLVLVVAAVVAIMWASRRHDDGRDDMARQVLDRRLAEGDLTVEEHAQRRLALREHGARSVASGRWGAPAAALAAVVLGVIVIAWLGMTSWSGGGWMGGHMGRGGSTSSSTDVAEGARTVEIEAGDLWFEPDSVEVTAGEAVNLRLVNEGEAFHDLTVPAADVVLGAEPGEQAVGAIELADPGRYEFYCSVPGHAQAGMRGTIVVATP